MLQVPRLRSEGFGLEHGPYSWIQSLCWSDDGKEVAWSAMHSEGKSRMVFGKQEYGEGRVSVSTPAADDEVLFVRVLPHAE